MYTIAEGWDHSRLKSTYYITFIMLHVYRHSFAVILRTMTPEDTACPCLSDPYVPNTFFSPAWASSWIRFR